MLEKIISINLLEFLFTLLVLKWKEHNEMKVSITHWLMDGYHVEITKNKEFQETH